jgi:hypothetical protein
MEGPQMLLYKLFKFANLWNCDLRTGRLCVDITAAWKGCYFLHPHLVLQQFALKQINLNMQRKCEDRFDREERRKMKGCHLCTSILNIQKNIVLLLELPDHHAAPP